MSFDDAKQIVTLQALALGKLHIDPSKLPPLLTAKGVSERIAPVGRSTLYAAASAGEIETVSVGAPGNRGRRLYVTISVIAWLLRRMAETQRPSVGGPKAKTKKPKLGEPGSGPPWKKSL